MDPVTVAALTAALTAAAGGAGGEAGKSAWTTLASTARRVIGRGSPASTALDTVEDAAGNATEDPDTLASATAEAAQHLVAEARDNPELATLLHAWYAEHASPDRAAVSQGASSTTNVVSGTAQVTNLIQARDVSGGITFGR